MFFDPSQTPLRLLAGGLFSWAPTSVSFGELEHKKGGMDELGSLRHFSFLREGNQTKTSWIPLQSDENSIGANQTKYLLISKI